MTWLDILVSWKVRLPTWLCIASILLFTSLTSEKNQRHEAEIYVAPFSRLNRPLTEKKELNKSNVWYSSSTVRSKGRISLAMIKVKNLPQVLGGPKKSDSIRHHYRVCSQELHNFQMERNCQSLNSDSSLLTVVLISFVNNELRQGSVFWAALHSNLSSLTYDVRVHCGKPFQVGQFRQVRSRPLKPSAEYKLVDEVEGEVFWGSTEPTGLACLSPHPPVPICLSGQGDRVA